MKGKLLERVLRESEWNQIVDILTKHELNMTMPAKIFNFPPFILNVMLEDVASNSFLKGLYLSFVGDLTIFPLLDFYLNGNAKHGETFHQELLANNFDWFIITPGPHVFH